MNVIELLFTHWLYKMNEPEHRITNSVRSTSSSIWFHWRITTIIKWICIHARIRRDDTIATEKAQYFHCPRIERTKQNLFFFLLFHIKRTIAFVCTYVRYGCVRGLWKAARKPVASSSLHTQIYIFHSSYYVWVRYTGPGREENLFFFFFFKSSFYGMYRSATIGYYACMQHTIVCVKRSSEVLISQNQSNWDDSFTG